MIHWQSSQSLLTVTSTMSLYEKALRGRRGPAGSKGSTAVPGQPTSSEACLPTLRTSPPLLLCPCRAQPGGSGKGFPESFLSCAIFSGDSQPASRQYRRRAAREGQCPVRGVGLSLAHYREPLWDSNFLPSFLRGQSRPRSIWVIVIQRFLWHACQGLGTVLNAGDAMRTPVVQTEIIPMWLLNGD